MSPLTFALGLVLWLLLLPLQIIGSLLAWLAAGSAGGRMSKLKWEAGQVVLAFNRLVNAVFGGWADETISGRTWRLRDRKPWCWLRPLIDRLFRPWEANHCYEAHTYERLVFRKPPHERMPGYMGKRGPDA